MDRQTQTERERERERENETGFKNSALNVIYVRTNIVIVMNRKRRKKSCTPSSLSKFKKMY